MKRTVICLAFLLSGLAAWAQTGQLRRSSPEAEGIPTAAVAQLFDSLLALPRTSIHSVMVLRHDKVVAEMYPEPFKPEYAHTLYSCSKTFVSAAVGIAIGENRLQLTDRVAAFFPDQLPDSISPNLASMTVRDLLVMASGIEPDWQLRNGAADWTRQFLSRPVATPGKLFKYDSLCTYMLSAIVQRVTGTTLLEYLRPRLFGPLGVTEVQWELSPEGINTGGWGLHAQSETLAKFGLLLMHHGNWHGRQLIPEQWTRQMMQKQIDNGQQGYGYQMWCCAYPGAARADGAFGQYIFVMPKEDMVIVVTQYSNYDGQRERNLFWRLLMPRVTATPLPAAPRSDARRLQKLSHAVLPTPSGARRGTHEDSLLGRTNTLPANQYGLKSMQAERQGSEIVLTLTDTNDRAVNLRLGYRRWITTRTTAWPAYTISAQGRFSGITPPFFVAGSYAWQGNQLRIRLHYVNWITAVDLTVTPSSSGPRLRIE